MPFSIEFLRQSHIFTIFLQIELSNVFPNRLPEQMQSHIAYIGMIFSRVSFQMLSQIA